MNDIRIDSVRGSAETLVKWSPIHDLHVDVALGISDDGRWVLQTNDGLIYLDEADTLTGLLPLLERSPSDVHSSLVRTLSAHHLPEAVAENFPTEELIVFGLNAWGKHWPRTSVRTCCTDAPLKNFGLDALGNVARKRP